MPLDPDAHSLAPVYEMCKSYTPCMDYVFQYIIISCSAVKHLVTSFCIDHSTM
jgi:hypothetical protein